MIARPAPDEMNDYFAGYVASVEGDDALEILRRQGGEIETFFGSLDAEELACRYAEGKWSLQEILGHLIDSERVFLTRALAFARQDRAEMPGFDENDYVREGIFDHRTIENMLEEFRGLRASTLAFFAGLGEQQLRRSGIANSSRCSVRALAWILAGHERHHIEIAGQRYLHAGESQA